MLRACTLAMLLVVCAIAGEAEAVKLPPAAQTALDRLAKAESRIDADARKARSSERQKAIRDLDRAQVSATKAGDLAGALAVKAQIDVLKQAEEDAAAELLGEAQAASKDPAVLAVGTWTALKTTGTGGTVELLPDKSAKISAGPLAFTGIWRIEKERVVINWGGSGAHWENLAFVSPDKLAGDSFDAGKDGITMTRLKGR
jgi:hypothetical protein